MKYSEIEWHFPDNKIISLCIKLNVTGGISFCAALRVTVKQMSIETPTIGNGQRPERKNWIRKTKIVVSLYDYLNRRLSLIKNLFITNTVYRYSIGAS